MDTKTIYKKDPKSISLVKYAIALAGCFLVRLLPWRAPNVEPILATAMPFAKTDGWKAGFLLGAGSVLLYDILAGSAGVWTLITVPSYGMIAAGSAFFLRKYGSSPWNYVRYSIPAIIAYDAATGLTLGPLVFGQSFAGAVMGQIPFTALHLIGGIVFALTVSPVVERWIMISPAPEQKSVSHFIPLAVTVKERE